MSLLRHSHKMHVVDTIGICYQIIAPHNRHAYHDNDSEGRLQARKTEMDQSQLPNAREMHMI